MIIEGPYRPRRRRITWRHIVLAQLVLAVVATTIVLVAYACN